MVRKETCKFMQKWQNTIIFFIDLLVGEQYIHGTKNDSNNVPYL